MKTLHKFLSDKSNMFYWDVVGLTMVDAARFRNELEKYGLLAFEKLSDIQQMAVMANYVATYSKTLTA